MDSIVELLQRRIWIGPLVGLMIGIGLGLLIGWYVVPVSWQPNADDVSAAADSYYLNNNLALARARLENLSKADQERILIKLIRDRTAEGMTREVDRLTGLAQALGIAVTPGAGATPGATGVATRPLVTPVPTPASSQGFNTLVVVALIVLVIVLIFAAGVIFFQRILPAIRTGRPVRAAGYQASDAAPTALERERPFAGIPSPPATTTPGGLGRFVPSYTLGNDNYDTSYSLETARGEFLGECGMGISETIGEGKPDKVVAFDLWLFDKADVRTVTQILMSEFAYKDQTLRTKLATKGEAVQVEKGKTLRLETASLRIEAQIVELVYATNPNYPPNSHFQKLIVEIVPALKTDLAPVR